MGSAAPVRLSGLYKETNWTGCEEQASKQPSSEVSASAPASLLPDLLRDYKLYSEVNPFFPKLLFIMMLITAIENNRYI